jgi:hypothetical protein
MSRTCGGGRRCGHQCKQNKPRTSHWRISPQTSNPQRGRSKPPSPSVLASSSSSASRSRTGSVNPRTFCPRIRPSPLSTSSSPRSRSPTLCLPLEEYEPLFPIVGGVLRAGFQSLELLGELYPGPGKRCRRIFHAFKRRNIWNPSRTWAGQRGMLCAFACMRKAAALISRSAPFRFGIGGPETRIVLCFRRSGPMLRTSFLQGAGCFLQEK